jgi:GxxExxY protein
MNDYPFSEITYEVIGAAMEVHRELGPGFLEAVYHEALAIELTQRNISFCDEPQLEILYKGIILNKKYSPDFLAAEAIIVEIKALARLTSTEESQIINYLKAAGIKIGLLFNFGASSLEFRRFIGEDGKVRKLKQEIRDNP